MRIRILGSGSSGNAALLQTEGAQVLIDAGFSGRKLTQMLHEAGTRFEDVQAIFITHEHGDHTAGLDTITKKHPHLTLFANAATARAVQTKLSRRPNWQVFQTGTRFRFRDLEIDAFSVPHDAQEPVGYTFASGDDGDLFSPRRSLAWLTDLGHIPGHVRQRLAAVDLVAIESNHCTRLLEADIRRPWSTKQRISGRHGHLSNDGALEILTEIASPRWRHICLTHLSRDCNSLEAVENTFAPLRNLLSSCAFSIVGPGEGTPTLDLV
ncbi:MBL fold metallo-hydrolase [Actomonas aquatica]|uniref:MBL fold metallo-hydrolase n=1 Tax=Actomonas aquatica TaxID=2866162 RepID=A0ABZ1C5D0_9BACT|nr:MBL fold metallo-hydrolase [Opitutus sp. WL0086]WRQ86936.1 MBL fold metallo-hydrolase [Opitutus sp. WL0086]